MYINLSLDVCDVTSATSCYKLVRQAMSWHDAVEYCSNSGGFLVDIHSSQENELVYELSTGKSCDLLVNANAYLVHVHVYTGTFMYMYTHVLRCISRLCIATHTLPPYTYI